MQYVRIKAQSIGGRRSWSRFRDVPAIDRYPLGSLERSTALLILESFDVWASSVNMTELVNAEVAMIEKFRLAHDVIKHKDYTRAASIVEDYVLTRKIDRKAFDLLFLPSLWRVLHRGGSGIPRTFTACLYDRQRVDKFFAACCEGAPPVMQVRGYLGFPTDESLQVSNAQENPPVQLEAPPSPPPTPSPPPGKQSTAMERLQSALRKKKEKSTAKT